MDIERIQLALKAPTAAPLHQKLRESIHEQIVDGTLKPGDLLPSERALEDFLGVSRTTVRQAVNVLISDGFLQSIAGKGTFVLKQSSKASATGLVGLITSSPNFNFFYPQLAAAFNQRIRAEGYGLVMSLHNEQADKLEQMVEELLAQNTIALAITPPRYGDMNPTLRRLRRQKIPLVFVGRNTAVQGFDVVATDNQTVGYEATHHLIKLGHKRIVYIGLLDYSTGNERAAGYQRAMQEAQLLPHVIQLTDENIVDSADSIGVPREHLAGPAQEVAHQIWANRDTGLEPTAAFCFNDIVAMGVYKGLRNLKYRIPDEVSLVSVDNLITVRHFEVPLTTFAQPGEVIGVRSAEILLRRLAGDPGPARRLLLPAQFVPGASTSSPAGTDH
jgi:GntR family transcriptional regulator of arabinose operon